MHAAGRGLDRRSIAIGRLCVCLCRPWPSAIIAPLDLALSCGPCPPGRRFRIGQAGRRTALRDWRQADCLAYIAWRVQRNKIARRHGMGTAVRGSFSGLAGRYAALAIVIALFALLALALRKRRKNAQLWPFTVWLYTITLGWILAWSTDRGFNEGIRFGIGNWRRFKTIPGYHGVNE